MGGAEVVGGGVFDTGGGGWVLGHGTSTVWRVYCYAVCHCGVFSIIALCCVLYCFNIMCFMLFEYNVFYIISLWYVQLMTCTTQSPHIILTLHPTHRGTLQLIHHLAHLPPSSTTPPPTPHHPLHPTHHVATHYVALLMPCHATPAYSHLHTRAVRLLMLDCSPLGWEDAVARVPWDEGHEEGDGEREEEDGESEEEDGESEENSGDVSHQQGDGGCERSEEESKDSNNNNDTGKNNRIGRLLYSATHAAGCWAGGDVDGSTAILKNTIVGTNTTTETRTDTTKTKTNANEHDTITNDTITKTPNPTTTAAHRQHLHITQASCFAAKPLQVTMALFDLPESSLLTHVAMFDHTALTVGEVLEQAGFVEVQRWMHAQVAVDDVPPGDVVLYARGV